MAQSKYEYVKGFESDDALPSGNWIVVRIQGRDFKELLKGHGVERDDSRALALVEDCLKTLLWNFFDIVCAYGVIYESSFVFHESTSFFRRRESKLVSVLVSSFTSLYVRSWPSFFPETNLLSTPVFSGAAYCYPKNSLVRSYLSSLQENWISGLQASNDQMGAFVFKRKVGEQVDVCSMRGEITSDAFWMEHSFILEKKKSKRSIIKARQRGVEQSPTMVERDPMKVDFVVTTGQFLQANWIVVRIDGRGFKKFADLHGFQKPNDERALQLMDECAKAILEENTDIVCAYGISDEYSFLIRRGAHQQASNELISATVSLFTSKYVMLWPKFFHDRELECAPAFDARAVCYPTETTVRDYLAWRQVDCHINNVNNTCFWKLREQGLNPSNAHKTLMGTRSSEKKELLSNDFRIDYNALPAKYRKGSLLVRKPDQTIFHYHDFDVIGDDFWKEHSYILQK
ncbi:probable tRNA(His) guanylyltransferase [Selaginella moellendorffii]|uniref:probable tRNA(His) guanylyltransferase n=1 Tax=Selaginella moellendorffii TaxID=88036 RepID=UPI000D1C59A3|nr:probable tRNA(His) guanylyltransferase [Selaginella moellendorffii]|eukprot:XP_024537396.1 probable tRNA(His) guanylyltransferase [Selaginella moellendorffii]